MLGDIGCRTTLSHADAITDFTAAFEYTDLFESSQIRLPGVRIVAPELLVGDDLKRGALVEPLPAWRGLAQPIHALTPPHRRGSAKARVRRAFAGLHARSEERRVGKECMSRGSE